MQPRAGWIAQWQSGYTASRSVSPARWDSPPTFSAPSLTRSWTLPSMRSTDRTLSDASVSVAAEPRATPYTYARFVTALREVGLAEGDTVFVHACLDTLGPAQGVLTPDDGAHLLYGALRAVLG